MTARPVLAAPECASGIICPSDCPCTPTMRRHKRILERALRRYLEANGAFSRAMLTAPARRAAGRP
jgi:hypothetical protein